MSSSARIRSFYVLSLYKLRTKMPHMKHKHTISFFIFAVFFTIAVSVLAESAEEATLKEHLIKLEKQSWEAWKNRDGKFFQEFLSDDHVEVSSGGIANRTEVVAFVGSPVCTVKNYDLDHFELRMLDKNIALLTYREAQDTVCHNPVPSPCWVSSLYMKRGNRWLNVVYQQTQIQK
jgi:hypothetical protein